MKTLTSVSFCIAFIFLFQYRTSAQTSASDEVVLRSIADNVVNQTSYQFIGVYNGQLYSSAKEIPDTVTVKPASDRAAWHYTNGVTNIAMFNLGKFLNDPKYTNNASAFLAFSFDNVSYFEKRYNAKDPKSRKLPFHQLIDIKELDDCGAIGASAIEAFQKAERPDYRKFIEKTAKHMMEVQDRLPDKTFVRKGPVQMTLWADDLYMSVPFLVRMGKFTGEKKYYDDAMRQVFNFSKYLWDPFRELYYHCWFSDTKQNGVAHWGRCNGWVMMAQTHLLNYLPNDYPRRDSLLRNLEKQIIGVSKYQDAQGLWHQILDKNDSYQESSCTAMFVYCIARAINENWIDKRYASIAIEGWEGLKKQMITPEGNVKSICIGTGIQNDLIFYYKRPALTDDSHGIGAIIDAGIEIIKLKQKLGDK
jgi:unsaturated rhamnogalacturonyl hydrolase